MAEDPMLKAKQELASQVKGIVTNCVELCSGVIKGGGSSKVVEAARDFSVMDKTMQETMNILKSTAAPLVQIEAHYDALSGIDMIAARMETAARDAVQSVRKSMNSRAYPSTEEPQPNSGTAVPASPTRNSEEILQSQERRRRQESEGMEIEEAAEQARKERERAELRRNAAESAMSHEDRAAIEQLIGSIDNSPAGAATDAFSAVSESARYSVEYYQKQESEVATPTQYSGAYAAALERNKTEARERAALEALDAENRRIAEQADAAAAKRVEAEEQLSANGQLEALEALIGAVQFDEHS